MTDHDYWLEDMQAMKKRQKPNYPRRRIKFALAVVALTSHPHSCSPGMAAAPPPRSWWKACTSPPHCG